VNADPDPALTMNPDPGSTGAVKKQTKNNKHTKYKKN
jgi:hypothetical protein